MIRRKIIVIMIQIIIFSMISGGVKGEVITEKKSKSSELETIVEGLLFGETLVETGKGSLSWEWVVLDSTSGIKNKYFEELGLETGKGGKFTLKFDINFVFDGRKMRCEHRRNFGQREAKYIYAYNGKGMDILYLYQREPEGLFHAQGFLTENNVMEGSFNPLYLVNNHSNIKYTNVSKIISKFENIEIIGEKKKDNIVCKVLKGNISGSDTTITFWLAPKLLFKPIFIEIKSTNWMTTANIEYQIYNNKLWFPSKRITKNYYYNKKTGEYILFLKESLLTHEDYELNIEIPDEIFKIHFPKGMKVYDTVNDKIVVYDDFEEGKNDN